MVKVKKTIIMISGVQAYLSQALETNLSQLGYMLEHCSIAEPSIDVARKDIISVILYIDDQILEKLALLRGIMDYVMKEDVPFYLIGNPEEINQVKKEYPGTNVDKEFERPICVPDVAMAIKQYNEKRTHKIKHKVLIVDDSGAVLRTMKSLLEEDYQVTLANSGARAIKLLSMSPQDLILLDYEMPICDGKQVMEMIRAEQEFRDIPIFFLTARADAKTVYEVMELKPQGYLLKTKAPSEIKAAIDAFMRTRME